MNTLQTFHSRWTFFAILLLLLFALSGCIPLTAEEATPVPVTPPSAPVVALAPPSARPGTTIFLSSAGWPANDVLTIDIVSLEAGAPMTTTIFTNAADDQGRLSVSFLLPIDLDQSDDPAVTIIVTSNTTGQSAAAPFLLAVATAMPTPLTPATGTATTTPLATATATPTAGATATPTTAQPPTPRPANFALVTSAGLNLRTGPAVAYTVIRALPAGTGLTVLGRNATGDWLYVRLNNSVEGWLAGRFTDYTGTAPIVETPPPPPTPSPTAVTTATPVVTEWRGEYYNSDALLYPPLFVRNDAAIDFNWGQGSPGSGMPNDKFSIRWTRSLSFAEGNYRFSATSDDGVRVWVDGDLIIDQWRDTSSVTYAAERRLSGGTHSIRVEYYENTQSATIRFWWERIDAPASYPDWRGEYWSNRTLDGNPSFVRNDEEIDFNWGSGAPDSRLPNDNFSARWTQEVDFDEGLYRFYARADDGIRLYLDGELILDEWHEGLADIEYSVDRQLDNDDYRVRVEYYERSGGARVEFWWRRISATTTPVATATWTPVPTATATPLATATATAPPPATATATVTLPATATATTTVTPTATATVVEPTVTATATETATATATPFPVATLDPTAGGAGTDVTIRGGGFPANTTVNVHLGTLVAALAAVEAPSVYATTTTDSAGDYQVTFTMPATWPDGAPLPNGRLVVLVATEDFSAQASAVFNYRTTSVTATPTVTPTATTLATVTPTASPATATPTVTATATVPPSTPPTASPTSTPVANVNLAPTTGGANTQVTVSGSGFPATTNLYVYLGTFDRAIVPSEEPEHYVILTTDAAGNYSGILTMPGAWSTGDPIAAGPVIVLVATNDFSVQAGATFTYTE